MDILEPIPEDEDQPMDDDYLEGTKTMFVDIHQHFREMDLE